MLTDEERTALVAVLALAENHQMWSDPRIQSDLFRDFADEQYRHIVTVRTFLKNNGVLTLFEFARRSAEAAKHD